MPNLMEDLSKPEIKTLVRAPRRLPSARIAAVLVLLIAIAAAIAAYLHFQDRVSSDDANVDGHISAIAAKISGNVVEVPVLDNQPVKTGQLLVRIDPRDLQAKVDMAKAAVLQAVSQLRSAQVVVPWTDATTQSGATAAAAQLADVEAELDRARIAYEQGAGADIAYAEANIRSKQANDERARADLARMQPLVDKAEISRLQFDSYVAAARVAESDLQASREELASAQKEAAIRKASLDAAQSRVGQAKAQLETSTANRRQVAIRTADAGSASAAVVAARANLEAAELQLSYASILAPIDGVVTHKSVEVGQIVAPGQGLMTIIPLNDVWVTANFKETQLANVHPGQRAEIKVDMYGRSVSGHVDSIAGATGSKLSLLPPENATGNFVKVVQRIPVKILVDNAQQAGLILRPGMNVDVTIFTR
ncbi:Secretion protein HlyD family protein [Candidatus Sulfopaludibacter sp. SbA4]|nr:Secretion protein HlyD family protein [Candidatus Sulfopaludibacter sp. SbA4]